jgi:hypothetical protein
MKYQILGALTMALLAPMLANSQTETLDYSGSPFTSLTIDGNLSNGLANAIPENVGELVFGSPLGPNLNNVAVTPVSWSFDGSTQFGSVYLNSSSPFVDSMSFLFSTDANGVPTAWSINVLGGILSGTNAPSFASVIIGNSGDSFSTGFSNPSCGAPPGVPVSCYFVSENNAAAGDWKTTVAKAPEIDPASAAGGLTILLGGLAVLGGRRK